MDNTVCVLGLGYIGLPTALMIAASDVLVYGVDIKPQLIKQIEEQSIQINEPGLLELLKYVKLKGKFKALDKPCAAEVYIITVPTPFKQDKTPDLSFVYAAFKSISSLLKKGDLIILESTVPVGTTNEMCEYLQGIRSDLRIASEACGNPDIHVAFCPERVIPGNIINELKANERIVGGVTIACAQKASKIYENFIGARCHLTNAKTAEMTKLTENCFRDVNIAFANELSLLCHDEKLNVDEVISLANRHPRVNILRPGVGVGGHCIAVDPWFLIKENESKTKLLKTARNVNEAKTDWVIAQIKRRFELSDKTKILCCGLAYKPNTDDLRESPALKVYHELRETFGEKVFYNDDYISQSIEGKADRDSILDTENLVVLLVAHDYFLDKNTHTHLDLNFC